MKWFFSRLDWNSRIPCVQREREIAYFEPMPSAHAQTFSLVPVKAITHSLCFSYSSREMLAKQK